jgi:hypothetical protein
MQIKSQNIILKKTIGIQIQLKAIIKFLSIF